jgi:sucrose-phosphate synthase
MEESWRRRLGFYLLHLHLHGLFRGHDLELGRDADTGGQSTYALELVRTLAARPEVDRVEVVTRLIDDRRVSSDYARPVESIAPDATLLRFACGPKRYLRKELLWPHLDEMADAVVAHLAAQVRRPDWIHAHYADAGHVGVLVSQRLGIPLVFTGHSLGREKLRRLLASGDRHEQIEHQYAIGRRIEAEERALAHCRMVVTSTRQEAARQYARYTQIQPERVEVIPPGVDVLRFHPGYHPPGPREEEVRGLVQPFLRDPDRSPLLAICRADRRKNIFALVEAFARSDLLRERHNLVLVLGCRHEAHHLDRQQRDLFQQLFELIDRHDLYGRIAYPKSHTAEQIPALYRWAARRRGVFVNPALTEPFGLTLLEAAASGLPVVATDDGGPQEIVARCSNGLLVDVSDLDGLRVALETAAADPLQWQRWSEAGMEAVSRHFSWDAHVCSYLGLASSRCRPAAAALASFGSQPQEVSSVGEPLLLPEPRVWITGAGSEIRMGAEGDRDALVQEWISA